MNGGVGERYPRLAVGERPAREVRRSGKAENDIVLGNRVRVDDLNRRIDGPLVGRVPRHRDAGIGERRHAENRNQKYQRDDLSKHILGWPRLQI